MLSCGNCSTRSYTRSGPDERINGCGICVRAGAHCAPLMHKALGTAEQGVVRFSFSHFNTEQEVQQAAQAVCALAREILCE